VTWWQRYQSSFPVFFLIRCDIGVSLMLMGFALRRMLTRGRGSKIRKASRRRRISSFRLICFASYWHVNVCDLVWNKRALVVCAAVMLYVCL
jgi:hypothetical protein